ncbi:MAG: VHS domain-containing protein [Piptocephalis tieghemiana]|nr:MAG: VHS domain-containing protein [Piptocephalis tieghemiana]
MTWCLQSRELFSFLGHCITNDKPNFIARACDPRNISPNLPLNLEVCDLVNQKEKSYDASRTIVRYVNSRDSNVSMLALTLLDNCVKNCGHPFHLQCASKEFLNELVKKFPEHPPTLYTPIQQKTLELLQEWRLTICVNSRYKNELVHILDMCRLLHFKGYRFPRVSLEHSALAQPDMLKSAEELEAEDQAVNAAKLQEYLRRGSPEDLRKANDLMQVMAGYVSVLLTELGK